MLKGKATALAPCRCSVMCPPLPLLARRCACSHHERALNPNQMKPWTLNGINARLGPVRTWGRVLCAVRGGHGVASRRHDVLVPLRPVELVQYNNAGALQVTQVWGRGVAWLRAPPGVKSKGVG